MTEQTEDRIIKFMGKVNRRMPQLFPRNRGSFEDGEFAILNFDVYEKLQGVIEPNTYGSMTIKGWNFDPSYTFEAEYIILAKHVGTDPKFGDQWECLMCTENINLKDTWQQKIFLQAFLNDNQIQSLFEAFDNPMEVIENGDKEKLKEVHGVGDYIADLILKKYEANKDYTEAYIELSAYGMNPNMIKKLCDKYGSAHVLVEKIKLNPYILVDQVKGVGFKTIDEMALHSGMPQFSTVRLEAYITYILNEGAQQGFSWITSGKLVDKIELELDAFPIETIIEVVNQMKADNVILDGEIGIIALQRYYDMERDIRDELVRIRDGENKLDFEGYEDRIKQAELLNGYPYTDEQKDAIKIVMDEQLSVITGGAGCVDGDTEYFNGIKWIRIADYTEGDRVLQFNENTKKGTMTLPQRYIKETCESGLVFKNKSGSVDMFLSDDHDFYYETTWSRNPTKKKALEIQKMHNNSVGGFAGKIPTAFNFSSDAVGIEMSEFEIRLMIAVFADGNFSGNTKWCSIRVKKQRKKDRLEWILSNLGIDYKKKNELREGFVRYSFYAIKKEKIYLDYWYSCNKKQMGIISDEVLHWDGTIGDYTKAFYSVHKKNVDFIQFVFAGLGYGTSIYVDKRESENRQKCYQVNIRLKDHHVSLYTKPKNKTTVERKSFPDGYKYCFTVPNGNLILRRNDRIFITGNCGKTTMVLGALKALGDIQFSQCSLSGKAAARMEEATGYPAATIHRTLGFSPMGGGDTFAHNEDNPLTSDVIVLDEVSMVGGALLLSLLKAIPTGCKLIMIGDPNQLPSIGALNVATDVINSPHVTVAKLTKIHRQAAKSGVITEAAKINEHIQLVDKDFIGKEVRGELKDLELDIHMGTDITASKAIEHFREKLAICNDIMEVQIIAPMRVRGESSIYRLNNLAQEIYNPSNPNKDEAYLSIDKDKGYTFRTGDKVLNVKNNYEMPIGFPDGRDGYRTVIDDMTGKKESTEVFNGYIGNVLGIENNNLIIYFPIIDQVCIVPPKHWKTAKAIELAYAVTCHKIQGSSADYPICVIDTSHWNMLSKEWVYTAITRSSKHCTLVAENKALQKAISTTSVRDKQTFLVDLLEEDYQNKLEEGV